MKKLHIQFIFRFLVILSVGVTVFNGFTSAFAEPDQDSTSQLIDELGAILEKSLHTELSDLEKYKNRIASEEQNQVYLTAAYNGYRVQLSSFWNLLLSEDADISQLQKSRAELKSSMVDAQKMVQGLIPGEEALKQELEHLENQKLLVDKQLAQLAKVEENTSSGDKNRAIEKTATRLAKVLKEKEALVSRLDQIYKGRLDRMVQVSTIFFGAALVIMILLACRWICRSLKTVFIDAVGGESNVRYLIRFLITKYVMLLISGVSLMLDMTGYELLSSHWVLS